VCSVAGRADEVAVFEAVGIALERDDFGVVDEAVDHRCGDDVGAELSVAPMSTPGVASLAGGRRVGSARPVRAVGYTGY
jgi:hypothetical protein